MLKTSYIVKQYKSSEISCIWNRRNIIKVQIIIILIMNSNTNFYSKTL